MTIINSIKSHAKWSLCVFIVLLIVINYFSFVAILNNILTVYVENILISIGYKLPINNFFNFIFNLVIPSIPVIGFAIDIRRGNLFNKLNNIHREITNIQMILYLILLPSLLFIQNYFYTNLINIQNINKLQKNGR